MEKISHKRVACSNPLSKWLGTYRKVCQPLQKFHALLIVTWHKLILARVLQNHHFCLPTVSRIADRYGFLTAHERFELLRLSYCPNETYSCLCQCVHGRLLNRGNAFAACFISVAARLSLNHCRYKSNAHTHTYARAQTIITSFSLCDMFLLSLVPELK
jgi:hypothetical protein